MNIILLCGYRRTGKDSFYQKLTNNDIPYVWHIYQDLNKNPDFPKNVEYIRTAFADALKIETSQIYGISSNDDNKDVKNIIHYKTSELVSKRDIFIEWASVRRLEDPNYWCKAAFINLDYIDKWIVVTDWRFTNEEIYVKEISSNVITCRLFRSDVAEPDKEIISEHELDNTITDFLFLSSEDEFPDFIKKFPQYKNYTKTGVI
jgi:hypothetical protein